MFWERLEAWKAAQEASRIAQQTWTRDYDQCIRRNLSLKEGSLVLCKVNLRTNTLALKWTGPARIIKKVGPVVYIVKDVCRTCQEEAGPCEPIENILPAD